MNGVTGAGASTERTATEKERGGGGRYLTFALDAEEYAVPVLKVREIIKVTSITSVPQLPRYIRGVINLRGKVIPVIDLHLKFGLEAKEYTDRTCIIIVDVTTRSRVVMMGLVVDSVSDVMSISADDLAEPPNLGDSSTERSVVALAKVKDTVKIVLNLDWMLGADGELVRR